MKITLLVVVVLVAGCGGGGHKETPPPSLPVALAVQLAQRSEEVARLLDRGEGCAALGKVDELRGEALRVRAPFRRPLLSTVNDLSSRIGCNPPNPVEKAEGKGEHGKGKHKKKHGKGHD